MRRLVDVVGSDKADSSSEEEICTKRRPKSHSRVIEDTDEEEPTSPRKSRPKSDKAPILRHTMSLRPRDESGRAKSAEPAPLAHRERRDIFKMPERPPKPSRICGYCGREITCNWKWHWRNLHGIKAKRLMVPFDGDRFVFKPYWVEEPL